MQAENFKEAVADCLDRRRSALTETERVVLAMKNNELFGRACAMAIPMLYANWEGYVKEVLQLYIEYLEKAELSLKELNSSLLAYAWNSSFRKLSGNLTHERKVELIERFLSSLTANLAFERNEREINTKSNLRFEVLEELAICLCLNIENMRQHRQKLNALVNRRNNIAHGGREQRLAETDIEDYRKLVLQLMTDFEAILYEAVDNTRFKNPTLTEDSQEQLNAT